MRHLPIPICLLLLALASASCNIGVSVAENAASPAPAVADRQVGGPCDGCELMLDGMPPLAQIGHALQLSPRDEAGEAMEIEGLALQVDGKHPASDVIFYVYHTDAKGLYSPAPEQRQALHHGHLRGWVRSDDAGRFRIRSIRPAPYPGNVIPAHIHIFVKEAGMKPYYIDEVRFDDDPLQTAAETAKADGRGGDLIMHLTRTAAGTWSGNLTIVCGRNIPDYPQ
jgi:protocatechuate 3,4-dioxygenase, beta subunit